MYLTKINSKTGLLDLQDEKDGILAITDFREVIEDKKLGLSCLTAVALVADYLSPIKFYSEEDRPRKAMEEVTGDRDKWIWKQEKIQRALKKYDDLQFDPVIEEGKLYYEAKIRKMQEYKESEKYYGKKHNIEDEDGNEKTFKEPARIRQEISKINDDIEKWAKQTQGKDIYAKSPVKNGYTLSRLEQKIEKKNSFYNETR